MVYMPRIIMVYMPRIMVAYRPQIMVAYVPWIMVAYVSNHGDIHALDHSTDLWFITQSLVKISFEARYPGGCHNALYI